MEKSTPIISDFFFFLCSIPRRWTIVLEAMLPVLCWYSASYPSYRLLFFHSEYFTHSHNALLRMLLCITPSRGPVRLICSYSWFLWEYLCMSHSWNDLSVLLQIRLIKRKKSHNPNDVKHFKLLTKTNMLMLFMRSDLVRILTLTS